MGIVIPISQTAGGAETAEVRFDPSGAVTMIMGSMNHGQGHDVAFTQILSEKLGMDSERINLIQGDTDMVPFGTGSFDSRTATLAGSALVRAADKLIAKGKTIAAHILEASETDIEFDKGQFTIAGTDRSVAISDVAKLAFNAMRLPRDIEPGFHEIADMRNAQMATVTGEGMRGVNLMVQERLAGKCDDFKTAVIAPENLPFGLSRLYEQYSHESPENVMVFREVSKALQWIGVDDALIE